LGYNPRGNSSVEVVFRYVNSCLRTLTDDEYKNWDDHVSSIAAAWNAHPLQSTGCSPFEIQNGVPMVTAADNLLAPPKGEEAVEPDSDALEAVRKSTAAYAKLAAKTRQWNRRRTARLLNKNSKAKVFSVGEMVRVWVPPSAGEAIRRGRKVKHCAHFRLARVLSRDSKTSYTVEDQKGSKFRRTLINLRSSNQVDFPPEGKSQDHSADEDSDAEESGPTVDTVLPEDGLQVDEVVAVMETSTDNEYRIGRVVEALDGKFQIWMLGTQNRSLNTSTFRHLYSFEDKGGVSRLSLVKRQGMTSKNRWLWVLSASVLPSLVVARRLELVTAPGGRVRLSPKSLKVLMTVRSGLTCRVD